MLPKDFKTPKKDAPYWKARWIAEQESHTKTKAGLIKVSKVLLNRNADSSKWLENQKRGERARVWKESAKECHSRADEAERMGTEHEAKPVSEYIDARTRSEIVSQFGHIGMECLLLAKHFEAKAKEAEGRDG